MNHEDASLRKVQPLMVPKNYRRSYSLSAMHKSLLESPKSRENFWSKVKKTETCWLWLGRLNHSGYGDFWVRINGTFRALKAHRVAYTLLVGRIPANMTLDHVGARCGRRNCVNPSHLEVVSNRENVLRGNGICANNARKTHCIHGHKFDEINTTMRGTNHRRCKACDRESSRLQQQRRRGDK